MLLSLKFSIRQLLKEAGFTVTALLTLALCLGANLVIFAIVDAVIIRSLPFAQSDRLVSVFNSYPGAGVPRASASETNYYDRRNAIKAFSSVSIFKNGEITVGGAGSSERVQIGRNSPEFFATLGVPLAMGRTFTEAEMIYGPDQVAILTDEYWHSHFGADPNILGKVFMNDELPVTVIGVLPRGFHYLSYHCAFFRPASHDAKNNVSPGNRHSNGWDMVARLAPGATIARAQSEIDAFNAVQITDDPYRQQVVQARYQTTVAGLHADYVRQVKPMLVLLQCGVAFLLLIGVVNLANLFLIRSSTRNKELAVRRALGARGWHIASEILSETIVVALAGGVLGILCGAAGIRALAYLGTDSLPLGADVQFNLRVATVALVAAVAVGTLLALPTIWLSLRARIASGLSVESRTGTAGRGAQRVRQCFVVVQVALAFVLLTGAGLLTVSLKRVLDTPAGFELAEVVAGDISLPWNGYRDYKAGGVFVAKFLPLVQALPGIAHAAVTTGLPFSGALNDSAVAVEGTPKSVIRAHYLSTVTPDYWETMNIPKISGRLLTQADAAPDAPRVCVIDQSFARRYFPAADPLGKRLSRNITFDPKDAFRIVGVVADVKENELAEESGHGAVYFSYPNENFGGGSFSLVVSSTLPPAALGPELRKVLASLDPNLALENFRSMQSRVDDSLVTRRSPAILAGIFAAVALLLAAIGTYGVLSYSVAQRQREIGVRMALGALPTQIRDQFLSTGARLLAVGAVLGLVGSWLTGRAMQSILFDVSALQGTSIVVTFLVMSAVALSASVFPARRAARVDPIVALRGDFGVTS